MTLKKLPIWIQTFSEIIKWNYAYIDKTKEAYDVINNYKYVFLSRPRRFGKSLFLDTLQNIFEWNKELFKWLYIYDKWDFEDKYPVIKISWDGRNRSLEDLKLNMEKTMRDNQEKLNISCEWSLSHPTCFAELIQKAYKKYGKAVVVLIDEYDKPILDVIEEPQQAKEHREYIKWLYSVLKWVDQYIKFAFLTWVSKFSKASIFSGLNMLTDISLMSRYWNICWYTEEELKENFKEHLDWVDLNKVRNWYNGYYFLKDKVYNPFDILKFIDNEYIFKNYWFSSGTPTFLIKLIEKNNYFLPKLSNLIVWEEIVNSFDIENLNLEVIMYQAGYLTIEEVKEKRRWWFEYKLSFPNKEVKTSFNDYIIDYLITKDYSTKERVQDKLYDSLIDEELNLLEDSLKALFASIPYNNYTRNKIYEYEWFYASVVYVYLQSLWIDIIWEDTTNRGKIDLTLFIEDKIYLIEFKVLKDEKEKWTALQQIKDKKYYEKYLTEWKKIYLVWIEFCEEEKNICNLQWEAL